MPRNGGLAGLVAGLALAATSGLAQDGRFTPGEAIEYKVGTATPETWERGVIIKALDGGKQYLVRQKPSEFFPEGPERAYYPADLRRPVTGGPTAKKAAGDATPGPGAPARPTGPLTEEDVLAYARTVFGGGDRLTNEGNPKRDQLAAQVRDYIKTHGVGFKAPLLGPFEKKLYNQGTVSVNIRHAIQDNFGPHPKLTDYAGTFYLRKLTRGGTLTADRDGGVTITSADPENETGRLTIGRDGTYEWVLGHGDPPARWVRGKWHEARPDETAPTEGGPVVVLEKARGGVDHTARLCRDPAFAGWLDVGEGPARGAVLYGRQARPK